MRALARDLSEEFILEQEGFRAKIDMAKPQQAICLIFDQRVNNSRSSCPTDPTDPSVKLSFQTSLLIYLLKTRLKSD